MGMQNNENFSNCLPLKETININNYIKRVHNAIFPGFAANTLGNEIQKDDYYYMVDGGQNDVC